MKTFHANGKLLLSGEYFVLDGALALAIPTRYGQHLQVGPGPATDTLTWQSRSHDHTVWFEGRWQYLAAEGTFTPVEASDTAVADRLTHLFHTALALGVPYERLLGQHLVTRLDFPRGWGLGSSSTLVSLLAEWLQIDAYALLAPTFGGSGYDLACAKARQPILYRRIDGRPQFVTLPWQPTYADHCFFVYLGNKQNSREGIAHYRQHPPPSDRGDEISRLSLALVRAETADQAIAILREHEALVGQTLALEPVQARYFADFPGVVKSLGAWGGDFVLAIRQPEQPLDTVRYFNERGFSTVIPFVEMIV